MIFFIIAYLHSRTARIKKRCGIKKADARRKNPALSGISIMNALCLKMREPFLPARQSPKGDGGNETDAPPRRRELTLATPQKSFLCISDFARDQFFLLKGKQNFSLSVCSLRAGRRGFASTRARRNSPLEPPFRVALAGGQVFRPRSEISS